METQDVTCLNPKVSTLQDALTTTADITIHRSKAQLLAAKRTLPNSIKSHQITYTPPRPVRSLANLHGRPFRLSWSRNWLPRVRSWLHNYDTRCALLNASWSSKHTWIELQPKKSRCPPASTSISSPHFMHLALLAAQKAVLAQHVLHL